MRLRLFFNRRMKVRAKAFGWRHEFMPPFGPTPLSLSGKQSFAFPYQIPQHQSPERPSDAEQAQA